MFFGSNESSSFTTSSMNSGSERLHTSSSSQQSSPRVETPTRLSLDGTEDLVDTMEVNPLRRITTSLPASSAAVHALFGESMGPCWGDFSCTHLRIRGRLYATSQAILFHTNLLGFERRICLLLKDVVSLELYRTTSIRIHTMDLETYIFKSFNDREQVLHLLNGLKILADRQQQASRTSNKNRSRNSSEVNPVTEGLSVALPRASFPPHPSTPVFAAVGGGGASPKTNGGGGSGISAFISTSSSTSATTLAPGLPALLPSPPVSPNRPRASSDSLLRLQGDSQRSALVHCRLDPIESSEELSIHTTTTADQQQQQHHGRLSPPEAVEDPAATWANIHQSKFSLQEEGIESLELDCSMDDYYRTFLADDAQYSLDYYQQEYVKDKNVELTGWDITADGDLRRTITFTHPIKNSMGIGPSSAQTCRHQRLRKFPGVGMVLENRTEVEGIPGADCFYIQDIWLLEVVAVQQQQQHDENNKKSNHDKQLLRLSVRYDVKFKKRSLFRNIIQKSVRKETKEWIAGYVDMVQGVLRRDASDGSLRHHKNVPHLRHHHHHAPNSGMLDSSSRLQQLSQQDTVVLLVGKLDQAYRLILLLVVIMLVFMAFFSYQLVSMKQCFVDMRTDLHQQQTSLLLLLQQDRGVCAVVNSA